MNRIDRIGGPESESPESGHLILTVMIALIVAAILLTAVVQQWSVIQRRENEEELIFRGNQYVKAIALYQKEHGGAYPTSLEILVKPGVRQLRYIRKLYKDPMAPDGKWGILLADPTGKGFINPNAPALDGEGAVQGLEDLGQGFGEDKRKPFGHPSSGRRRGDNPGTSSSGSSWDTGSGSGGAGEDEESVTAPNQPIGPIVGVVSLYDTSSYRRYREHENYADWTFSVFDLMNQQQQNAQQPVAAVPTLGSGIGPGGAQTIFGGANGPIGGSTPNPFGRPGTFGKQNPRTQPPPP